MKSVVVDEMSEVSEAQARVGRTLRDKWHLDAMIDVGGMAAVYAATHRNGMRGAVKILHHHRSLDPDIATRFRREGYIANKVAHPNAVRVLDDDVDDDGSVFLVMELLTGSTLRERASSRGGKLAPDEVLLAADPLLDVLACAHDLGIVHRDVKPENLFVTHDGQLRILDFGIARLIEPVPGAHSETMDGMPMGSPSFMSPEQARGRWDLVGPQSDVWSVGATLFNLLSGEDVHMARTVPELLAEIFTTQARSLSTALPGCHPAVVSVVDRALKLRLAERWPDARSMQAAVRAAYRELMGVDMPPRVSDRLEPRLPSSPTYPAATAVRPAGPRPASREATTAVEPPVGAGGWRQRVRRPAVLTAALLLATGVGIASAARDSRSEEARAGVAAMELGEVPPEPQGTPMTAAAASPEEPENVSVRFSAPGSTGSAGNGSNASPEHPIKVKAPSGKTRYPAIFDQRR